jgi:hypothetical protein
MQRGCSVSCKYKEIDNTQEIQGKKIRTLKLLTDEKKKKYPMRTDGKKEDNK